MSSPPEAAEGTKAAAASKDTHMKAQQKPPAPKPKTKPKFVVHSRRILDVLLITFAVCVLGISRLFRPGFWTTLVYAAIGVPAGVVISYLYFQRGREKRNLIRMLNIQPGAKGLKALVGHIPTWVRLSDGEKAEWMNAVLLEMWPWYDAAICDMIQETVTPILNSVKPIFIKSMGFSKLQFGDSPVRIEAVRFHRERDDIVFFEFDFRWAGDAQINLAIDIAGLGNATRLVPKISKMRFVGTLGIQLRPYCNEVPGFGAAIITLIKSPKISYRVDLGAALGGNITGSAVKQFVSGLIPTILEGYMVWPNRIVCPILPKEVTGPLDDLRLRHQGILKLWVLKAQGIPRMDRFGTSDSSVEFFTDPRRKVHTSTKKNTLEPVWDEQFYLLVQEPQSQKLKWEMFDTDMVNAKNLFTVNVLQGVKDAITSKETMSKGEFLLNDVCVQHPGKTIEKWFPCGSRDWSADDGPGDDCGEIQLRMIYIPLPRCNPMVGEYGVLIVQLEKGRDFPRMVPGKENSCNPYVVGKVGNNRQEVPVMNSTCNPEWDGARMEFYNIPNEQELRLKFYHKQALQDEELGYLVIDIRDVREAKHRHQRGCLYSTWELMDADSGSVELECLFVPYF